MIAIKRVFGYVHILLGLVIGGQYLASEMYDDAAVTAVWNVLDVFMAVGAVGALVFSYMRSREANRSDLSEWIGSTAMLIASGTLFLVFFEHWFAWAVFKDAGDEIGAYRWLMWAFVDVMFVVVSLIVGNYLLRSTKSA